MKDRLERLDELTTELAEGCIFNGVANIQDDEEMYDKTLQIILDVTQSKHGIFGYIDEKGVFVCPSMTRSVWKQCEVSDKSKEYPPDEWGNSIWGRAIKQAKTLYSNKAFLNLPDGHIPMSRALMVPIKYHGNVIGLFEVANKQEDYTEKDIRSLECIAKKIAPILNGRLRYQETKQELALVKEKLGRLEAQINGT